MATACAILIGKRIVFLEWLCCRLTTFLTHPPALKSLSADLQEAVKLNPDIPSNTPAEFVAYVNLEVVRLQQRMTRAFMDFRNNFYIGVNTLRDDDKVNWSLLGEHSYLFEQADDIIQLAISVLLQYRTYQAMKLIHAIVSEYCDYFAALRVVFTVLYDRLCDNAYLEQIVKMPETLGSSGFIDNRKSTIEEVARHLHIRKIVISVSMRRYFPSTVAISDAPMWYSSATMKVLKTAHCVMESCDDIIHNLFRTLNETNYEKYDD